MAAAVSAKKGQKAGARTNHKLKERKPSLRLSRPSFPLPGSAIPLTPVGRGTAEVSAMIRFMSRKVIWNPFRGGFRQKWKETGRRKARNVNNKDELTKCRHMVCWLFGRLRDEFKKNTKKKCFLDAHQNQLLERLAATSFITGLSLSLKRKTKEKKKHEESCTTKGT